MLRYPLKKTATGKHHYVFVLKDRRLMAVAGLWETWRSPAGERIRSFTIATTTRIELCAELHMPVVLKPEAWPAWLGEAASRPPEGVPRPGCTAHCCGTGAASFGENRGARRGWARKIGPLSQTAAGF